MNRRDMMKSLAAMATVSVVPHNLTAFAAAQKYGIKQSVCYWCYGGYLRNKKMTMEDFCAICRDIGILSIELNGPNEWKIMKPYGLISAMASCGSIPNGYNRIENHEKLIADGKRMIDNASEWGYPNVICFSGNCNGMDKEEGLRNCAIGLRQIAPYAESKNVTLCMELLNSHGHKDYMCDQTDWAVRLVKEVDSPGFKILYDIFHAAEMGEDPIKDIREHHECFGHYHTGGYPGRAEIDLDSQKLDYAAIMKEIAATGYKGYVGQEFCPRRDAIQSLKEAFAICDI
ncbi:MAG: sugar phosphate isomerase/epimerase family protein [Planctomycetia bacterium]|nr:sugar phosphate isomerase/epimerase family protein [Planctomycetia bacterium]